MTELSKTDLTYFTGSLQRFRHSFNSAVIFTEGVQYVAEHGRAYWLIDAIASHLATREFNAAAVKDSRISLLHFWRLAVSADRTAHLLAIVDSDEPAFIEQAIAYTDFPLDEVSIWAARDDEQWTLMLPSEY